MAARKNEAAWIENSQRWQIKVQQDGVRRTFYSLKPGKKGKIEAEKKADAWLASGKKNSAARIETLWDAYVAHELEVRGPKAEGYLKAESLGRLYIKPRLGTKRMSSITEQDWQDVIDFAYINKHLSYKYLSNIRGVMTSFWKYCRRSGIAFREPTDPLLIPQAAQRGERSVLQPSDLKKLFSIGSFKSGTHLYTPPYLHLWRFAVITGMRPGEIVGLRKEDIRESIVTIRRSINVRGEETQGKNRNAQREFILTSQALSILQDQDEYLKSCGIISPWVFPAKDGGVANQNNIYTCWKRYCKAVGITPCSVYELRHTFVSISASVPDALLQPVVGHSSTMPTRRIYGHEIDGQKAEAAALISEALSKVLSDKK
jgi:integrase